MSTEAPRSGISVEAKSRAYFEMRLAFSDRPRARVRLEEDEFVPGVRVHVREQLGDRAWAVAFIVQGDELPREVRERARRARAKMTLPLAAHMVRAAAAGIADLGRAARRTESKLRTLAPHLRPVDER